MAMFGGRFVAATLAALSPVALIADATLANGGAFFDFDRTYYVPGEVVSAETTFSTQVKKSGRIDDGPYHAYLLSSDRWIQPPRIPDDAVPIGRITTTSPRSGAATAQITFTVPQIQTGPYTLTICNLPCTRATLGDLVGGSFSVASTKEEALRKEITDRMNGRIVQVRQNLAARIRDVQKAQGTFATRTEVQRLLERVSELEAGVARLQDQQALVESGAQTAPWIMAGLLILLSVGLLSRRRHRPRSEHAPTRDRGGRHQPIPMFSEAAQDAPGVEHESEAELDPARL
jgi:hypothetical protein